MKMKFPDKALLSIALSYRVSACDETSRYLACVPALNLLWISNDLHDPARMYNVQL